MKDMRYVLENFFTHKDFLAPPEMIPGTIGTPLSIAFELTLLAVIVLAAVYVSRRKRLVKPVLVGLWAVMVVWEFVIIGWDSLTGRRIGMDLAINLSLYPCSIYLYALPLMIWGKGVWKQIGCGYMATLGFLGAAVNFLYPVARLTTYSCISFAGFHTFSFHGTMLFTWLVMLLSGMHSYRRARRVRDLFLPCVLSLIVSVPANLINYSPIQGDYMYFRGQFPLVAQIFRGFSDVQITLILYALYILVPAMFYLPSYLLHRRREEKEYCVPIAA